MAARLKDLMPKIIPDTQFAFVPDRLIFNNTLLAQVLHSLRKAKAKDALTALKVDLNKVYDKVIKESVIKVMTELGFCKWWCDWIWECIFTSLFSIIVNDKISNWFHTGRGSQQGKPLSPFLVLFSMMLLDQEVRIKIQQGIIRWFGCGE